LGANGDARASLKFVHVLEDGERLADGRARLVAPFGNGPV
jgi:hypothetical protein